MPFQFGYGGFDLCSLLQQASNYGCIFHPIYGSQTSVPRLASCGGRYYIISGQTTENQRLALARVAEHRGWEIVQTYEDAGISGAKGRDQRPAFNQMLKDAVRGRFGVLMVWSIDRLGRSVLHVASAMAEMDAAGVALYSDQQAIDSTSPFGKAMMQMACVFGELEREMIRARVVAGLNRVREQGIKKLGRPPVGRKIEEVIRRQLGAGHGILKVAKIVGCGSGTVQRVKREIVATTA